MIKHAQCGCSFVQPRPDLVLPCHALMAFSIPQCLLLLLCEQGSLGIYPDTWMTAGALMLKEFQPPVWEIKTLAGVGN